MDQHVLKSIKVKEKGFNVNAAVERCSTWLITTLASRNCFRLSDKRPSKCKCLDFLNHKEAITKAAAMYMVQWAGYASKRKKEEINTWIRYSGGKKMVLPLKMEEGLEEEDSEPIFVCHNAIFSMLNIG